MPKQANFNQMHVCFRQTHFYLQTTCNFIIKGTNILIFKLHLKCTSKTQRRHVHSLNVHDASWTKQMAVAQRGEVILASNEVIRCTHTC